jgi:hypothetical protein
VVRVGVGDNNAAHCVPSSPHPRQGLYDWLRTRLHPGVDEDDAAAVSDEEAAHVEGERLGAGYPRGQRTFSTIETIIWAEGAILARFTWFNRKSIQRGQPE